METLTLPLAVVGIVSLVKLLGDQFKIKISGAVTIIVAAVAGGVLAFIDLESTLVQGIYTGVVAVGGITALQNLGSIVKIGDSGSAPEE